MARRIQFPSTRPFGTKTMHVAIILSADPISASWQLALTRRKRPHRFHLCHQSRMFAFRQPPAAGLCQAEAVSLVPQHSLELAACQLICLLSASPGGTATTRSKQGATGSCILRAAPASLSFVIPVWSVGGPAESVPSEGQTNDQALPKSHSKLCQTQDSNQTLHLLRAPCGST